MKKLSAIIAAALIAVSVSTTVFAEPSSTSSQHETTSSQSSEISAPASANDESSKDIGSAEGSDAVSGEASLVSTQESSEKASGEASSSSEVQQSSTSSGAETSGAVQESSKASEAGTSGTSQESSKASGDTSYNSEVYPTDETKFRSYRVEEAGMSIAFPENMYVITRDVDANDPALKSYRLTKAEILKNFEESNTYIKASASDFSYDITITVDSSENTAAIDNLSNIDDNKIQGVIDNLLSQPVYKGCSRQKYNNVLYLSLSMEYTNNNTKIMGIQEYTIVNGKRVIITIQSYSGEIDPQLHKLIKNVMESTVFDGVNPEPQPSSTDLIFWNHWDEMDIRYIYLMAASVIGIIVLAAMIIIGSKYSKSKKEKTQIGKELYDEPVRKKKSKKDKDKFTYPPKQQEEKNAAENETVDISSRRADYDDSAPFTRIEIPESERYRYYDDQYNLPEDTQTADDDVKYVTSENTQSADSGVENINPENTKSADSGVENITPENTQSADSSVQHINPENTQSADSGVENINPENTQSADSGVENINPENTKSADSSDQHITQENTQSADSSIENIAPEDTQSADSGVENITPENTKSADSRVEYMTPEDSRTGEYNVQNEYINSVAPDKDSASVDEMKINLGEDDIDISELPESVQNNHQNPYSIDNVAGLIELQATTSDDNTDLQNLHEDTEAFIGDTVQSDNTEDNAGDDIVFAESTPRKRTQIEQISEINEEMPEEEIHQESTGEISEYEKRFGKNRVQQVTPDSSTVILVNEDEKRMSKYEKHFGKPTAVAKVAENASVFSEGIITEGIVTGASGAVTGASEAVSALTEDDLQSDVGKTDDEKTDVLSELKDDQKTETPASVSVDTQTSISDNSGYTGITNGFKSGYLSGDAKNASDNEIITEKIDYSSVYESEQTVNSEYSVSKADAAEEKNNDDAQVSAYTRKTGEDRVPAVIKAMDKSDVMIEEADKRPDYEIYKAQTDTRNNIELQITRSADGSIIIGAKTEDGSKPVDVEIKDGRKLRAERDRRMIELGLPSANENEIYNAADEDTSLIDRFKAKTTDNEIYRSGDSKKNNSGKQYKIENDHTETKIDAVEKYDEDSFLPDEIDEDQLTFDDTFAMIAEEEKRSKALEEEKETNSASESTFNDDTVSQSDNTENLSKKTGISVEQKKKKTRDYDPKEKTDVTEDASDKLGDSTRSGSEKMIYADKNQHRDQNVPQNFVTSDAKKTDTVNENSSIEKNSVGKHSVFPDKDDVPVADSVTFSGGMTASSLGTAASAAATVAKAAIAGSSATAAVVLSGSGKSDSGSEGAAMNEKTAESTMKDNAKPAIQESEGLKLKKKGDSKKKMNNDPTTVFPENNDSSEDRVRSKRAEFSFERDSGITFERPRKPRTAIVPNITPLTSIPRLESVKADEYAEYIEGIKKSMEEEKENKRITAELKEAEAISAQNPPPPEQQVVTYPSQEKARKLRNPFGKFISQKKKQQPSENDALSFYTGYDPSSDPFDPGNQDKEMDLNSQKHSSGESMGDKLKKSFGRIFSGADDEIITDDDTDSE